MQSSWLKAIIHWRSSHTTQHSLCPQLCQILEIFRKSKKNVKPQIDRQRNPTRSANWQMNGHVLSGNVCTRPLKSFRAPLKIAFIHWFAGLQQRRTVKTALVSVLIEHSHYVLTGRDFDSAVSQDSGCHYRRTVLFEVRFRCAWTAQVSTTTTLDHYTSRVRSNRNQFKFRENWTSARRNAVGGGGATPICFQRRRQQQQQQQQIFDGKPTERWHSRQTWNRDGGRVTRVGVEKRVNLRQWQTNRR